MTVLEEVGEIEMNVTTFILLTGIKVKLVAPLFYFCD